jgi:uncharacterized protein
MLIRFSVSNVLSFDKLAEFNMLPAPRYTKFDAHKYDISGLKILKIAALYGSNGAGKSNLVKSLLLLQSIVLREEIPARIKDTRFKFTQHDQSIPQVFAIEFFQNDLPFYYAIEIVGNYIRTEELYISGLGNIKDQLLFERKTNSKGECKLKFSDSFEANKENQLLKNIIEKNLAKPNKSLLKLLSSLNNSFLQKLEFANEWFEDTLRVIRPNSKPVGLAQRIDIDQDFKEYAVDIMSSLHIGITNLKTDKKKLNEFFGEDDTYLIDDLIKEVDESPEKMIPKRTRSGEEIIIVKEGEDIFVKQLKLEHEGLNNTKAIFDVSEQSDGTVRLLDFVPAFRDLVTLKKVYVIDEAERSIHPSLIKELIKKFTSDNQTLGQLIFSTHESNLLDLDIFRQDEIWFAEKNRSGSTELYSLSDFKEHNTIDIRKGYLNGRYGSVPFLANLHDLNWHNHVSTK